MVLLQGVQPTHQSDSLRKPKSLRSEVRQGGFSGNPTLAHHPLLCWWQQLQVDPPEPFAFCTLPRNTQCGSMLYVHVDVILFLPAGLPYLILRLLLLLLCSVSSTSCSPPPPPPPPPPSKSILLTDLPTTSGLSAPPPEQLPM